MPSFGSSRVQRAVKRGLDVVVSAVALLVLAPLLLAIAVVVRVSLGAPVLYAQERPGRHEVPFRILKFRTMRALAPGERESPESDAARLTTLGRLLRATSLDELPEFWNILVGDMSLVGPRPLLIEYLPLYNDRQRLRHAVRPGLTGWAQVNGRNAVTWEQRLEMDAWYVEHWSLALDASIVLRTITVVLRREGVSADGVETMTRFTGTPTR